MKRKFISTLLVVLSVLTINNYVVAESTENVGKDARPLTIGLLPHLNSRILLRVYEPLIKHLEQTLQRPVHATSAPDFATYYKRSSQGQYDLYLTAPHHAAYAEAQNKARRLSKFARPLYSVFVVRKDSPYKTISDLKGRDVAMPDYLSVTAIVGELTLAEHGLIPNKDVSVKYSGTHGNAMILTANKSMASAVVGVSAFEKMKKNIAKDLRILTKNRVMPHMMFMAKSGMENKQYENIKNAMLGFNAKGAGKKFFADSIFGDMSIITNDDMHRLAPLLPILIDRL